MLRLACDHASERVQFGRPIASFQAVRHRLAEALVAVEALDATLGAAGDEPNALTAALAKATAGRTAQTVAGTASRCSRASASPPTTRSTATSSAHCCSMASSDPPTPSRSTSAGNSLPTAGCRRSSSSESLRTTEETVDVRTQVGCVERRRLRRHCEVDRREHRAFGVQVQHPLRRFHRLLRQRGDLVRGGERGSQHLAVGAHVVGEPDLGRARRADAVAGERVLLREEQARVQRPRERTAVGSHEPDGHVRIGQVRRLGHVHDVGERDHAAAEPDRRAVDRGDDRDPAAQHVEHELAPLRDHVAAQRSVVDHAVEQIEVAAGGEGAPLPGDHRDTRVARPR